MHRLAWHTDHPPSGWDGPWALRFRRLSENIARPRRFHPAKIAPLYHAYLKVTRQLHPIDGFPSRPRPYSWTRASSRLDNLLQMWFLLDLQINAFSGRIERIGTVRLDWRHPMKDYRMTRTSQAG